MLWSNRQPSGWEISPGEARRPVEVTLSRKGAKKRTHGRKLRSTGTKGRARVGRIRESARRAGKGARNAHARTRRGSGAPWRGAGAADRDFRGAAGHFKLARRAGAVFQAMLANATPYLRGQVRHTYCVTTGRSFMPPRLQGAPPAFAEWWAQGPKVLTVRGRLLGTPSLRKQTVHVADLQATDGYTARHPTLHRDGRARRRPDRARSCRC